MLDNDKIEFKIILNVWDNKFYDLEDVLNISSLSKNEKRDILKQIVEQVKKIKI